MREGLCPVDFGRFLEILAAPPAISPDCSVLRNRSFVSIPPITHLHGDAAMTRLAKRHEIVLMIRATMT